MVLLEEKVEKFNGDLKDQKKEYQSKIKILEDKVNMFEKFFEEMKTQQIATQVIPGASLRNNPHIIFSGTSKDDASLSMGRPSPSNMKKP